VDRLDSPAYSTSVGLLKWDVQYSELAPQGGKRRSSVPSAGGPLDWEKIKSILRRLLP